MNIADMVQSVCVTTDAGIIRNYKPQRFDMNGFNESIHPEVLAMHREAQWMINDIVNKVRPRRWLALLGASGVGKSHLGRAIRDAVNRERPNLLTQFWSWHNVVARLRGGEWEFLTYLANNVDVLIIDDIGAENSSPAILAALNRLADSRLNKWTVWTSNLLPDQIREQLDARIASRLFRGNNVVCRAINAPDYYYELKK